MPTPQPAPCSKCGFRSATHHVCYGGTGKSLDLCDDCMATEGPVAAALSEEARNARCRYCSGSPCCGGSDSFAQLTGEPAKHRWMCLSCSAEYYSFMQRSFTQVSKNLPHAQQIHEIGKIVDEAEAHMKSFVRQRDN